MKSPEFPGWDAIPPFDLTPELEQSFDVNDQEERFKLEMLRQAQWYQENGDYKRAKQFRDDSGVTKREANKRLAHQYKNT